MKILILGARGMLGTEVSKIFRDAIKWDIEELDVTSKKQVIDKITKLKPELVINCAAYTDVDSCEDNRDYCFAINGEAVEYIAKACNLINAKIYSGISIEGGTNEENSSRSIIEENTFENNGWKVIMDCDHVLGLKDNWYKVNKDGNHVFVLKKKS